MGDPVAEFQGIVGKRDTAYAELSAAEKRFLDRFNALINKRNTGAALSEDEMKDLKESRAALASVHHSMWIVGQISLQAMEDSSLLRDIKNNLENASSDLKDAAGRLKTLREVAQTAAEVTGALVQAVQMAAKAMAAV